MAHEEAPEDLIAKLAALEEILAALRNQEVDAVVGTKNLLMLRLKEAEDQLTRQREYLEGVIIQRTRELRELSHRLVDAQEKERAAIGNELHDEIGQHLTYAILLIDRASRKADPELLQQAKSSVHDAIIKIRDLSSMLSPRLLRSAGLEQAVLAMTQEYANTTSINVTFDHRGPLDNMPQDLALASYRIIQESLTNAARHSGASVVTVRVERDADKLHVEVADNGRGFDVRSAEHSPGLVGMKERAVARGGELRISSNQGGGTRIAAELPLPRARGAS